MRAVSYAAYFELEIGGDLESRNENLGQLNVALNEAQSARQGFDDVSAALGAIAEGREDDPLFAGYRKDVDPRW